MEDYREDKTETEFNSSVATLRRIDELMRQLHDLSRGIIPTNKFGYPMITGNPHELYISTTERLYLEGHVKFDDNERERCSELKLEMQKIKERYGVNLKLKKISKGMPPYDYDNKEYYIGWDEMLEANEQYEAYVVECLDRHGMLMKNKDDSEYALR